MTIDEYLAHLKDLEAKATPGPWKILGTRVFDDDDAHTLGVNDNKGEEIIVTDSGCYPPKIQDAEFISESRTTIPKLIKIMERMLASLRADSSTEAFLVWKDCEDILNETEAR